MLGSDGRTVLVLLSLLAGTWGSSVLAANQIAACSTGFTSTVEAGPGLCSVPGPDVVVHLCDCRLVVAAAGLLEPPASSTSTFSCSYLQFLPIVPEFVLIVLVGLSCVSLVRDRRLRLTAVDPILSFSRDRSCTVPSASADRHDKRHAHRSASCGISLYDAEQVPLYLWRRHMPWANTPGRRSLDVPVDVIINPLDGSDFHSSVALITDDSGRPISPLVLAQCARGPPP